MLVFEKVLSIKPALQRLDYVSESIRDQQPPTYTRSLIQEQQSPRNYLLAYSDHIEFFRSDDFLQRQELDIPDVQYAAMTDDGQQAAILVSKRRVTACKLRTFDLTSTNDTVKIVYETTVDIVAAEVLPETVYAEYYSDVMVYLVLN